MIYQSHITTFLLVLFFSKGRCVWATSVEGVWHRPECGECTSVDLLWSSLYQTRQTTWSAQILFSFRKFIFPFAGSYLQSEESGELTDVRKKMAFYSFWANGWIVGFYIEIGYANLTVNNKSFGYFLNLTYFARICSGFVIFCQLFVILHWNNALWKKTFAEHDLVGWDEKHFNIIPLWLCNKDFSVGWRMQ